MATIWLLGDPVAHSLSPLIQNTALESLGEPAVYLAARVTEEDFLQVVESLPKLGAIGANVTVPHKVLALQACSQLTDRAKVIGAVNTLIFRSETVLGDNTDGVGWWESLREAREAINFKRLLVLGAGGAARAVAYTALEHGISEVALLNRTVGRAQALAEDLWKQFPEARIDCRDLPDFSSLLEAGTLVVQTTSLGLHGDESPVKLPSMLPPNVFLSELIYGRETRLLREFRDLGGRCSDGLGMLVGQAVHALALWLGRRPGEIPAELMLQAACCRFNRA